MNETIMKVLLHVATFRVILPETYQRNFLAAGERKSASQALKRLERGGYLRSYPLSAKRKYFALTWKAVRWLRKQGVIVPRSYANPIKPLRLPTVMSVLHYCGLAPVGQRRPFRPAFDTARFPRLAKQVSERRTGSAACQDRSFSTARMSCCLSSTTAAQTLSAGSSSTRFSCCLLRNGSRNLLRSSGPTSLA